jgi:hypothetical protein
MIKSLVCSWLMTFVTSWCMAGGGVAPVEVSAEESHAVRAVVEAQLKALASEDSTKAFAYASPSIQNQFQDASTFMNMVRGSYPMLIRPVSMSFLRPEAGDGVITQAVEFRDREGNFWRATYELERQADKTWRINGCAIEPDDDKSTT